MRTSTDVPLAAQAIDAGKKIVGCRCGIITDPLGLLLAVIVTAASVSDNMIGMDLLNGTATNDPTVTKTWPDAGLQDYHCRARTPPSAATSRASPRIPRSKVSACSRGDGSSNAPSAWLMQHRRIVRDYEARPDNSASMTTLAMIDNLAKRLTAETTQPGDRAKPA